MPPASPLPALQLAVARAIRSKVAGPDAPEREQRIWGAPGERWFAPDSPIARVHEDASMYVGGIRALLLQSLHPLAMAGVAGHSGYKGDPWGRLQRTSEYIAVTTFGRVQDAERVIARIRGIHRRVKGDAPDGRPYAASDPHLLKWVHLAEIESFLTAYQVFNPHPLSPEDADHYVSQTSEIATRLGVVDPPQTVGQLHDQLWTYGPELEATPAARETVEFLIYDPPLPPSARAGLAARRGRDLDPAQLRAPHARPRRLAPHRRLHRPPRRGRLHPPRPLGLLPPGDAQTHPGAAPMNGAQLYDLLFPVVTRESAWRPRLISQLVAGLPVTTTPPGEASSGPVILDVGAGTGKQALAIADAAPHARVIAVEPGSNVHAARQKPNPHQVEFIQGEAQALPLAAGSVDRIVISLALHHMSAAVRRDALAEFRRVLKADGRLHVVEFGKPSDPFMRAASAVARRLDDYDGMRDPYAGRIPAILIAAGFHVRPGRRRRTPGGVVEVIEAWPA